MYLAHPDQHVVAAAKKCDNDSIIIPYTKSIKDVNKRPSIKVENAAYLFSKAKG